LGIVTASIRFRLANVHLQGNSIDLARRKQGELPKHQDACRTRENREAFGAGDVHWGQCFAGLSQHDNADFGIGLACAMTAAKAPRTTSYECEGAPAGGSAPGQ
jgi:hypothetical protein